MLGQEQTVRKHTTGYGPVGSYNNGNNYNNNGGGDPYNNNYGPYDNNNNWQNGKDGTHITHRHFVNDINNRDVRINQPIDNSGDINRANADAATKLNCDSRTICQGSKCQHNRQWQHGNRKHQCGRPARRRGPILEQAIYFC